MANLTPTTFQLSDFQNWNEYLQQEGYVVIQNILPESEKKKAFNLFKKDWNTISPNFNFEDIRFAMPQVLILLNDPVRL